MIVMKFGGTSVADSTSVERVAEIIRERLALRPVIVVSAMGKTTRMLLEAAEAAARGDSRTTLGIIANLKEIHAAEARQLVKDASGREVFQSVEKYFDELKKLLEGLDILGEVPPRGLDKILSYGELLSSAILADALRERGIRAHLLDARDFIKTDDRYGAASPLFELTNSRIQDIVRPVIEAGSVPVLQGFIGSTRDGATTTLGFEGSDYTAAIVGSALRVDDIQIWKDVSGLMTADPAVFSGARTVKICTFAEAAELTFFGAKVLHPKAIYPAAQENIPVHIYNSKQPAATGTTIIAKGIPSSNLIKSIAYKRPVTILRAASDVTVVNPHLGPQDSFLKSLVDALQRLRLTPLITAVSAASVALALDGEALNETIESDLLENISQFCKASTEKHKAIVTLVGERLRSEPRMVGRLFKAIDEIDLGVILHGSSPIGMSLVIDEHKVEEVITRLHAVFFQHLDPQVFE